MVCSHRQTLSLVLLLALAGGNSRATAAELARPAAELQLAAGDELRLGPKSPRKHSAVAPSTKAESKPKPKSAPQSAPAPAAAAPVAKTPKRKAVALVLPAGADANPEDAWNAYFDEHVDVPLEDVRETVRQLMGQQQFAQVTALIQAALVHGQAQSWMYEALALALQAGGSPKEEVERALMSAVDFAESADDLLYVAQYMVRLGLESRALKIFQQMAALDPSRPEPYAFGLQLAQRVDDDAGIQWASLGVLSQAWPREKHEVEQRAYRAALASIEKLKAAQQTKRAAAFQARLDKAMQRDCVVIVSWTGDADVDLFVEEPSGTICSLRNPRTTSGGVMLGEGAALNQQATSRSSSETYVCPQGFSGAYRLLLRRIFGKVTAGQVTVDVYLHYGSKQMKHFRHQLPLSDQDTFATFDLADGRRQQPLDEQQLASAVAGQVALNQALLTQQLNSAASSASNASGSLGSSRAGLFGGFPFVRGAVGYQPVIITLPAGANFSATGVISADRRYVRITALPLFSQIGQVTTFNIASGQVGTSPTPPPGGGGVTPPGNAFPPANNGNNAGNAGNAANANPNPVANPVNGNPQ